MRLPLRRTVGLNEADDRRSGQGLCRKDSPLQLDPESCERIAPQDDLARFHVKNLPARADRAGCQRHCGHKRMGSGRGRGGANRRGISAEKWQEKAEVEVKLEEEVGRKRDKIGLGDCTGGRMSHIPRTLHPTPHPWFLRQQRVTSLTTHKSVRTVRGQSLKK